MCKSFSFQVVVFVIKTITIKCNSMPFSHICQLFISYSENNIYLIFFIKLKVQLLTFKKVTNRMWNIFSTYICRLVYYCKADNTIKYGRYDIVLIFTRGLVVNSLSSQSADKWSCRVLAGNVPRQVATPVWTLVWPSEGCWPQSRSYCCILGNVETKNSNESKSTDGHERGNNF